MVRLTRQAPDVPEGLLQAGAVAQVADEHQGGGAGEPLARRVDDPERLQDLAQRLPLAVHVADDGQRRRAQCKQVGQVRIVGQRPLDGQVGDLDVLDLQDVHLAAAPGRRAARGAPNHARYARTAHR